MGCAPSQNSIIHAITKNATRPLRKHKAILPPDHKTDDSSIPFLVKGSSVYDTDGEFNLEAIWHKQGLQENKKTFQQNKNETQHFLTKNSSLPDLHKEKNTERQATDAEMAMSQLINYQKHITEDIQLQKQISTESELAFSCEKRNETNQKKGRKSKSQKLRKQGQHTKLREKKRLACDMEQKVDFPDLLVKAHQNAYAYLNPNLSKYEAIVCIANQATQTQLILQQMVSFLAICFGEMNRLLQEIVDDGEDLLKEAGKNFAWPLNEGDSKEQPDLLQQLLQYTVNKMQVLNEAVASLTSNVLQETCSYLESAANNFQEKLKLKQQFDKHMLRIMKLLEAYTIGSCQSNPYDLTLYSEDSGIGVDNESFRQGSFPEKPGIQGSSNSSPDVGGIQSVSCHKESHSLNLVSSTHKSKDCVPGKHFKQMVNPAKNGESKPACPSAIHTNNSAVPECSSLTSSFSFNSLDSFATLGGYNSQSDSTEDDCYEVGDDESLSEMLMMTLPRRPTTSPARTSEHRPSYKKIANPENEEMTQKMKYAISEKIKFVPLKSSKNMWTEEEEEKTAPTRPSSASGCRKSTIRQRRSRSAESLKSQAEDPTLLELQRTQKELNKRFEKLNLVNRNQDVDGKPESLKYSVPSTLQDIDRIVSSSSTNKLKASLNKNFTILPNQDKITLTKYDQRISRHLDERKDRKSLTAITPTQESACREENENPVTKTLQSNCASPRQSVKKLIETFSLTEGMMKPTDIKSLGPLKCIRKFGVPVLPPTSPIYKQLDPLNHKPIASSSWITNDSQICTSQYMSATILQPVRTAEISRNESNDDTAEDLESLPPPPLEILMDNSFTLSSETENQEENSALNVCIESGRVYPCVKTQSGAPRKTAVSQKMKVSLNVIDLLPSKHITSTNMIPNKMPRNSNLVSKFRKYSLELHREQENTTVMKKNHEMEQAAHLYKQSHKIILLPDPGDVPKIFNNEQKEPCEKTVSVQHQKQTSTSLRKTDKIPAGVRKGSPTKTSSSPPTEKTFTSSPIHQKRSVQAPTAAHPRPPPMQRQVSPPVSPRIPSPPAQKRSSSPPAQQKMLNPPLKQRQKSPPAQQKLPSPPTKCRDESPSPICATPSPQSSPSLSCVRLRNSVDSSTEFHSSSKFVSNAHSIFCPAITSLFEAKPPSPTSISNTEAASQNHTPSPSWKNNFSLRQCGDQQKRMAMSAANPQPFVRRCYSDRRPGVKLQFPASISVSANNKPAVQQVNAESASQKETETKNSQCLAEFKGSSRSASHPELCIMGQGLQKEEQLCKRT
ncbi:photoreceptor cilium actin regulator [Rhinatrema bivittatum]|uniref:photoreceptor cilium actin regulator n=1 Tax=Rhinatrema bivittatum TaxID=194408 RepID=UPI00112626A4|nr:photoreceptor cilium actin regulator [Rhinatrema bivittatum]